MYKIILVKDMCRQNFPINSVLLKKSCMFLKDFLVVAQMFAPIPMILRKKKSAFLLLFYLLRAQESWQV